LDNFVHFSLGIRTITFFLNKIFYFFRII
jgi:hypothetical protein